MYGPGPALHGSGPAESRAAPAIMVPPMPPATVRAAAPVPGLADGPIRPAPQATAPGPAQQAPIFAAAVAAAPEPSRFALPPLAAEAAILADNGPALAAYRFAAAPDIFVLRFASLAEQADMLNRIAALVERGGYPRDRILGPAELDRRIRAAGDTPERVYLGHDYRSADVLRFFALAEQQRLALTPGEARLRRMLADWGWTPATQAALVSLPREDRAAGLDPAARATILRHELSHGLYFTDPAYARYAQAFWSGTLIDVERGRFRTFLGSEGYDMQLPDLMVNEMQAYLMHTTDARYFNPSVISISARRLDALRILFLSGMPPGWLRDCTVAPGPPR